MKLTTPNGVTDIMPDQYARKLCVETYIEDIFHRNGYRSVQTAMFEYNDVFAGTGSIDEHKVYRLIDRDGSILALRPDITPQIARIAVSCTRGKPPYRYCYIGSAFRYNESLQGKQNEFTQAGAEIYGASSVDADAEIISVAIQSLIAAGLRDFRIDIGNVAFIQAALDEAGLPKEDADAIQRHILKKDFVSAAAAVQDRDIPPGVKAILTDLALYIGDSSVLAACENNVNSGAAKNAIKRMRDIYEILCIMELDKYVLFDLSLTGHLDYYTGMIFRGYAPGSGFTVAEGGRCDGICSGFGKSMPSVGFAVNINDLLNALPETADSPLYADTLIAYEQNAKPAALRAAALLRENGMYAETALETAQLHKHIPYAKAKSLAGILYFTEKSGIILYDLKADNAYEVTEKTITEADK